MSKITFFICGIMFFSSCFSQPKGVPQSKPSSPLLPYMALDRSKLDTTYEYEILKKPIFARLPDSVFGKKLRGSVEFFVMLNNSKEIEGIKIIAYQFFHKRKMAYVYSGENNSSRKLSNTLRQLMQREAVKQNKEAVGGLHPTYCFITF